MQVKLVRIKAVVSQLLFFSNFQQSGENWDFGHLLNFQRYISEPFAHTQTVLDSSWYLNWSLDLASQLFWLFSAIYLNKVSLFSFSFDWNHEITLKMVIELFPVE